MEHLALYRKYRPKNFQDVIGQDHITRALANQIASGKIGHAYLFTGSRGIGKTSVARIFAKAVNCEHNINGSPCGQCPTCKRLEGESDINIIEIDAASNNRVDDIREIREKVKFTPVGAKYKVYIIDEVHMLTDSAFNALLKTLEEPPSYVIFILATTEAHKLPATILSRCIRFDFRLVSVQDLVKLQGIVQAECIRMQRIHTRGSLTFQDTLSIADCIVAYSEGKITKESVQNVLGTTDYDILINFFDILKDKDIGRLLETVSEIDNSKNLSVFVKELSKQARNLLICKSCARPNEILNLPQETFDRLLEQAQALDEKTLIRFMQIFGGAENELRYTLSPRLLLETLALSAIEGDSGEEAKKN